ncbi:MAG TPA: glycosyltransferase family 9 protein [Blastocatellia bacterium]|nr:glycosyltransferase family 9 protein [Blastocatellia bacterium]
MRILIVKLGAIGDVVHTLPALAALRRAMPEAHITWVVERGGAAKLLRDNPALDELIEVDTRGWRKDLLGQDTRAAIKASLSQLRGFDVALDFQGLLKSGMMAWLSRAPRRIGFCKSALREPASAYLLTELVNVDDDDHIIKKNLQLVAHLGVAIDGAYEFPLGISCTEQQFAEQQIAVRGGNVAIINPGGGWPTKLWNVAGFAEIADRLWEAYGWRSVVTYGPGEEALAQSVITHARSGAVELLDSTLKQFFALAQQARLFIGGDTGPLHLAAAAGTPIVGIYGPTPARRNGPFAAADVIVERFDLDCRVDCFRRSCSHTSCMNLPIEAVWQKVIERLRNAECGVRNTNE